MHEKWLSRLHEATKVGLSPDGLYLGQLCVIRKQGERYRSAFLENDVLCKIARLLDEGLTADAIFLANFIRSSASREFYKANFNPAEPRVPPGQWTKASASDVSPLVQEVQYRGHFHNAVVDDLIEGLNAKGSVAIGHIEVFGINGVLAIPDGASLPNVRSKPYFIEVKTGDDPPFTENQQQVYPLICKGGHAVSFDPRISRLGLTPGQLLPPMDIMVVHIFGPRLPLRFFSYCKEIGIGDQL